MIGDMVAVSKPIQNFVFTNSIVTAGQYPVWSTGGGPGNCAFHNHPLATFNDCFVGSTLTANVILQSPAAYPPADWPANNHFPTSADEVQFIDFRNGDGGNYRLKPSSPYKGMGNDGKDIGADVDTIDSVTSGVERGEGSSR